jgi:uncharacterized protein YeaO (DUF488 family)
MSLRVVRLGAPRLPGEGMRIGTVRLLPRGVPKTQCSKRDWFDVWFPNLAPSVETMRLGRETSTPAKWAAFARRYKAEMDLPHARHDIRLLAAPSHSADFSVGCYCQREDRCHRSILMKLLIASGATVG